MIPGVSSPEAIRALVWILAVGVGAHFLFLVIENLLTPSASLHHELAVRAIRHGAFARMFWLGAIVCGGLLPLAALLLARAAGLLEAPAVVAAIALVAMGGSFAWEYVWVEAGQSVPLS
jgi:hypothetical protein